MKKIFFGSLAFAFYCVVASAGNANAQVTVVVTPEGQIVSMYGTNNSPVTYQSGSSTGFRRLGNVDLRYSPSSRTLERIGNVLIAYESTSVLKGKIKRVGNLLFSYSTSGRDSGKINRISARKVMYDLHGRMTVSMRFPEQGGSVEVIIAPTF